MATVALAQRLVPEFADLADDVVQDWLDDAATLLNGTAFGASLAYALCYYAGHLYLQAQGGVSGQSAGGPVAGVRDRNWSVNYAASAAAGASASVAELSETVPGRRFLQIRKMAGVGSARVLS